jgi:ATP-dependent protease ClpP protease subunit
MDKLPDLQFLQSYIEKPISRIHKFYLNGEIKSSSEYTQWFEAIRTAPEHDVIMFHINSPGGDLFTAIQFMRVMSETKATIVASVEGACMSAATIIFLCAKHWEISNHSMFMFHNYSSGSFGKGGEMYDNIVHERTWSQKLWRDIYTGFLTTDEIDAILQNKDIWMSGEEVTKRLKQKAGIKDTPAKSASKPKKKVTPKKTPTRKKAGPTKR